MKMRIKSRVLLLIAIAGIGLAVWLSIGSKSRSPSATVPLLERKEVIMEKEISLESKITLSKEDAETIVSLLSEKPLPTDIEPLAKDDISFLSENNIIDEKESKALLELENLLKGEETK